MNKEQTINFLDDYFNDYKNLMFSENIYNKLSEFKELAINIRKTRNKLIFAGNGASASISSHCSIDFTKQANVRAINFNESNLITCYSNDYGYKNWIMKAIESYADNGDLVVLISVSGTSPSIVEAAKYAKKNNLKIITFTGRSKDNELKKLGDINFWVNSNSYNIVECIHMTWITTVIDLVIGKKIYET
jgi:D-sedoheptulose 7-phosphate isomerase